MTMSRLERLRRSRIDAHRRNLIQHDEPISQRAAAEYLLGEIRTAFDVMTGGLVVADGAFQLDIKSAIERAINDWRDDFVLGATITELAFIYNLCKEIELVFKINDDKKALVLDVIPSAGLSMMLDGRAPLRVSKFHRISDWYIINSYKDYLESSTN